MAVASKPFHAGSDLFRDQNELLSPLDQKQRVCPRNSRDIELSLLAVFPIGITDFCSTTSIESFIQLSIRPEAPQRTWETKMGNLERTECI
jgi:hypothetical protein